MDGEGKYNEPYPVEGIDLEEKGTPIQGGGIIEGVIASGDTEDPQ